MFHTSMILLNTSHSISNSTSNLSSSNLETHIFYTVYNALLTCLLFPARQIAYDIYNSISVCRADNSATIFLIYNTKKIDIVFSFNIKIKLLIIVNIIWNHMNSNYTVFHFDTVTFSKCGTTAFSLFFFLSHSVNIFHIKAQFLQNLSFIPYLISLYV